MIQNDFVETRTDFEIDILLSELPFDVIKESIKEQIEDPLSTNVDFLNSIYEKCSLYREEFSDDGDSIRQLYEAQSDFAVFVIREIDKKFNLSVSISEMMSVDDVVEMSVVLYNYFILRYRKNITKFVSKFIRFNKKSIVDKYENLNKKDVTTLALKKNIKNKDDLTIITNLPSIIKYIFSLDIDPSEFIMYSTNSDSYEATYIINLMQEGTLAGDFVDRYTRLCFYDHDYLIDEIHTDIKMKLLKKMKG